LCIHCITRYDKPWICQIVARPCRRLLTVGVEVFWRESGMIDRPLSPAGFGRLIADETEKWAKVIKIAGIMPE